MSVWKHSGKLIVAVMALAVCLCLGAAAFSGELGALAGDGGITMEYESELFNTDEIIEIDILIDEETWENMLANATAEEYCECDVVINGETICNVAIRPKGNTSLTTIAADPTTDRYSFKIEFDHYVDGQTCFGLDKLVLNNNYADATSMKEALIYDMYSYFGADASLYNYAKISVNGEYWGVYLALEAVEDSFMLRNYGVQSGELYKPDSMNIGGFDMGDMDFGGFSPSDMPDMGGFDFSQPSGEPSSEAGTLAAGGAEMPDMGEFDMGGFSFGGFSLGGGGADLNYTDDDPDSYSTIWEGAKTDTTDADHERVITALRYIAEGSEPETYMDVDNLLRYMAVHVFSVNEDSLSGMMAHNYYLYEYDGQLNIIPWDYNLALGGMSGSDATSVVNEAIDNAFSGTDFFDTLMEDETCHAQYCEYLRRLVDEYINGGGFDEFYERVRGQIDELVRADPSAFYTYDEYLEAVEMLYELVKLRGESIRGQLDGTIPSTTAAQSGSDALIDASHLELEVMGSMDIGGGGGGFSFGGFGGGTSGTASAASGGSGDMPQLPQDFDISDFGGGELPEGFDPGDFAGQAPGDTGGELPESAETAPAGTASPEGGSGEASGAPSAGGGSEADGGMPSFDSFPGTGASASGGGSGGALAKYGLSFAVFAAALAFALLYRRRPRRR